MSRVNIIGTMGLPFKPYWVKSYYLEIFPKLIFHPGDFFSQLSREGGTRNALIFYIPTCIIYSVLAGMYGNEERLYYIFIYFANSIIMPIITAILFYIISTCLCRDRFSFRALFAIAAYSNVTLILAWIPGMAWIMGLWRIYLNGLGMAKVGRICMSKAIVSVLMAGIVMIFLYRLFLQIIE